MSTRRAPVAGGRRTAVAPIAEQPVARARRAPVVCAAIAAALAVGLTGCGLQGSSTSTSSPVVRSTPQTQDPTISSEAAGALRAAGRRFARAYLAWEVGQATPGQLAELRSLVTPALRGQFAQNVSIPPAGGAPPRARLVRLTLSRESETDNTVSLDCQLDRAGRLDRLGLAATTTPTGRPLITFIIPPTGPLGPRSHRS